MSCSCPSLTRSVPRLASMHPRHYLLLVTVTSRFNNIISSIIKYVLSRISVSSTTAPPWSRILALLLEISVSLCHYHAHNQTCMNCMRCTIRIDSTPWEVGETTSSNIAFMSGQNHHTPRWTKMCLGSGAQNGTRKFRGCSRTFGMWFRTLRLLQTKESGFKL